MRLQLKRIPEGQAGAGNYALYCGDEIVDGQILVVMRSEPNATPTIDVRFSAGDAGVEIVGDMT